MQEFKVTYKNGDTQRVKADTHGIYGEWIVFTADRKDVLRIAASEVKSVANADVPDAEPSAAVFSA